MAPIYLLRQDKSLTREGDNVEIIIRHAALAKPAFRIHFPARKEETPDR
jgi:hypothetical protein